MATVEASIYEPRESNVTRRHFRAIVKNAHGEPVAGRVVSFALDGDGSLAPTFSAREGSPETDAEGRTRVTWYRRGIFTRNVKSSLTASCDEPDCTIELETIDPSEVNDGAWISWVNRPFKIPR